MTQNNPVTININGSSLYANSQLLGLYNITGGDNVTLNDGLINVDQDPSFNTLTVSGDIISQGRNILNDIDNKQDSLTAGTDLEISGNIINYTGSGGGSTYTFNSPLNESNDIVSVDLSSKQNIINKPMFHVTNETNGNVTFGNSPSIIPFNSINPAGCFEIGSGYNYTTYKYTIPKSGIWRISLRVFINTSSTTGNARISLLKNDLIIATVGNKIGNAESLEILYDFSLNDVLETTAERMMIWMGHGHSYWTGEWVCNSDGTI